MLYSNFIFKQCYSIKSKAKASFNYLKPSYTNNSPSIFHKPKLNITSSNSVNVKFFQKSVTTSRYTTVYPWTKPIIFVKNCRKIFLYYFFLKKNKKSLSTIFSNLKKHSVNSIFSFFFKTVGYAVNICLYELNNKKPNNVYHNNTAIKNFWCKLEVPSTIQLSWDSRNLFYTNKRFFRKTNSLKVPDHVTLSSMLSIKGLIDVRTNTVIFFSNSTYKSTSNFLNLRNTSTYNWKIII